MIIAIVNQDETDKTSQTPRPPSSTDANSQSSPEHRFPDRQAEFIIEIEEFADAFSGAKNELQESALRKQRADSIAQLLGERSVIDWVGEINKLETTSDGKAILYLRISPQILIATWNNALSDIMDETLIPKEHQAYRTLFNLQQGDWVKFSGSFVPSAEDFIRETSLTIRGSMKSPEFLFRFNSIQTISGRK